MDKADIAERIHTEAGLSRKDATAVLESILTLLKTTLRSGEDVSISGFGKFLVRSKRARVGRNPHTGEQVTIAARRVVTYKASAVFKGLINGPGISTDYSSSESEGGGKT